MSNRALFDIRVLGLVRSLRRIEAKQIAARVRFYTTSAYISPDLRIVDVGNGHTFSTPEIRMVCTMPSPTTPIIKEGAMLSNYKGWLLHRDHLDPDARSWRDEMGRLFNLV